MAVSVRPMRSEDVDAVDRLWHGDAVPWPGAAFAWGLTGKLPARLLVAEDLDAGGIVGYASYIGIPLWRGSYAPLRVRVGADRRGEGIGGALWRAIGPTIEASPVDRWFAQIDRDDAASRAIAGRHGGREVAEHIVSVIDLTDLPPADRSAPLPGAGLRRPDLADPVERDRMYELLLRLAADAPDTRGAPLMTRELFDGFFTESWQMLVLQRGDDDVALTSAAREGADGHIVFTGVHPDARGRGVARWLKVRHAEQLREMGMPRLRTENMADNAAILAVNRGIGFRVTGGYLDVVFEPSSD